MGDVTLVADLLIATIAGIRSKKQIGVYYALYEKDFPFDPEELEGRFRKTIDIIYDIFGDRLRNSEFHRIHLFFTLFTVIFHVLFDIPNLPKSNVTLNPGNLAKISMALEKVDGIYATEDIKTLTKDEIQFLQDSRRATTDSAVRIRRTQFVLNLLS